MLVIMSRCSWLLLRRLRSLLVFDDQRRSMDLAIGYRVIKQPLYISGKKGENGTAVGSCQMVRWIAGR